MVLELKNVSTVYGRMPMLQGVSLKVAQGETVCILGANGAGKTTLLKTILGMVKPVEGSVHFAGQRIDGLPTHRVVQAGIAIVPEREGLFPKMTVENNLTLGAYYEKDREKIGQRLEEVFGLFPVLRQRLKQKAGTLSGGERKMLGIARALLASPKLILMDEPSLGLAPAVVNEVFAAIDKIKQSTGAAILLVEQNATKALAVAERGYVLQKGRIILEGTAAELKESSIVKQSYLEVSV